MAIGTFTPGCVVHPVASATHRPDARDRRAGDGEGRASAAGSPWHIQLSIAGLANRTVFDKAIRRRCLAAPYARILGPVISIVAGRADRLFARQAELDRPESPAFMTGFDGRVIAAVSHGEAIGPVIHDSGTIATHVACPRRPVLLRARAGSALGNVINNLVLVVVNRGEKDHTPFATRRATLPRRPFVLSDEVSRGVETHAVLSPAYRADAILGWHAADVAERPPRVNLIVRISSDFFLLDKRPKGGRRTRLI